jgi:hypothetical protein
MQNDAEKISPDKDKEEQAALVERILSSNRFVRSSRMRKILSYLFKNSNRYVDRNEIALDVFQATAKDTQLSVANNVGERCSAIRGALEWFAKGPGANEAWRCELPGGIRREGYKLKFIKIKRDPAPTELFWRPHLDMPDHVMVVGNSYLFFYDPALDSMFRFSDVNVEGDNEEALEALKRLHPKAYKESLKRNYFYLSSGEVNAHEMLQRWFHEHTKVVIPRYVSRDVMDRQIHDSSPILLGRPGANRFIRRILDSPEAAHLRYRFRKPLGAVQIDKPRKQELQALSRFPLSENGVLGPVPKWEVIFGIVTRLPNPSRQGSITIVSADYYPRVITQIMATLTDDQRLGQAFAKMGWSSDGPLPESFEMLFAVRLSPGNIEGEGRAELLCGNSLS